MEKDPFRAAYEEHVDFVWRLLRYFRVPADERHDAAQEVFVVLSVNLHQVEPGGVQPYLYGVARRVAARRHRWAARFVRRVAACTSAVLETIENQNQLDPEQQSARNAELERFFRLLDQLGEKKREAFILIEIESMTAEEAAKHIGVPANTVSSRLLHARLELRKALGRELVRESWRYRWTI